MLAYVDKYLIENIRTHTGPTFLEDPVAAGIVEKHLNWGVANRRYFLHAWSIMPNHVHAVIETLPCNYTFSSYQVSWAGALQRNEEIRAF